MALGMAVFTMAQICHARIENAPGSLFFFVICGPCGQTFYAAAPVDERKEKLEEKRRPSGQVGAYV